MADAIEIIYWICGVLAVSSALITLMRIAFGPTVIDRAVAVDLLTAVGIAVVTLVIAWQGRGDLGVLLIIFALTGFFSSVVVARYAGKDAPGDRAILSKEEAKLRAQRQQREEERKIRTERLELIGEEDTQEGPLL